MLSSQFEVREPSAVSMDVMLRSLLLYPVHIFLMLFSCNVSVAGLVCCGMKMLVFGGSGRTGQVLVRVAQQMGWQVQAPAHAECELADARAVSDLVLASDAALVVNAAAISGLEACLDDPLKAHVVNAVAPAAMALACRHTGARFVHLSTDYVLDGRRAGKKMESAKCKPVSVYGESKREGELQVLDALPGALVARVSWICGNPLKPAFVEQLLMKALAGQALAAIADKQSMPTDAEDIARVVLALAASPERGVLHVCAGGEPLSWYDCAVLALQTAVESGYLAAVPQVAMQKRAEVPFFREERPAYTAMDNSKLLSLGIPMPDAAETIRRVSLRFLNERYTAALT